MLIIGHRGSDGTHHENTIESLQEALSAHADMIEIDIRLTKDRVPILSHNLYLYGTKMHELALLRRYTFAELQKRTSSSKHPLTSLDEALRICYGKTIVNIEIKEIWAVDRSLEVIARYAKKPSDWDNILISSFSPLVLWSVRKKVPYATLGMLHYRNPLVFAVWHKILHFSAVGFHRLFVTRMAVNFAKELDLLTYVYTVNNKKEVLKLEKKGIDAIVTDYPARLRAVLSKPKG